MKKQTRTVRKLPGNVVPGLRAKAAIRFVRKMK